MADCGFVQPIFRFMSRKNKAMPPMKTFLKIFAFLLLLFNGTGALYGGWSLITQPSGSGLGMDVSLLESTPFHDFTDPGIVLFIANGLFSMAVLAALLFKHRFSPWLVILQGIILTGWIVVQVLLIQTYHPLQLILGSVGALLIATGWLLQKEQAFSS